ncbi:MAG: methionine adenosyltransferase [Deltaproteobacteria bacterium]|nr:methionine adenosyltransferase [Deltaproteobacteria bacterium]
MKKICVEIISCPSVAEQAVEMVERKGLGHPDYICDAALESVSIALSHEYMRLFGTVLHHNIDKGLLVAGQVKNGFGGGRVIKPMEFIIGDRATFRAGRRRVPVAGIAESSVREWFKTNLPRVDEGKNLKVRVALQPGSTELSGIFDRKVRGRKGRLKGANDTSAAVGYAPMTPTEDVVYKTERFINSSAFKLRFPETGEDVKVMGIRTGASLDITIACPFLSKHVRSEKEYFLKKAVVLKAMRGFAGEFPFKSMRVNFNTLDVKGRGVNGVYLSLLGTSAEDADSGQVGRGNRVNGVISLNRPMGTEAAAGKNPVSHVGKIYTVLAHRMAHEIYERLNYSPRRDSGIKEVYVWLLSQIGAPIDMPKQVYVKVVEGGGRKSHFSADKKIITKNSTAIVDEFLSGIGAFTGELSRGEHPVC